MTDEQLQEIQARYEAQRIFVEGCRARFPDLREPWLHQSDDGLRLWLTDGEHGPVLAETTLPPMPEEADHDR